MRKFPAIATVKTVHTIGNEELLFFSFFFDRLTTCSSTVAWFRSEFIYTVPNTLCTNIVPRFQDAKLHYSFCNFQKLCHNMYKWQVCNTWSPLSLTNFSILKLTSCLDWKGFAQEGNKSCLELSKLIRIASPIIENKETKSSFTELYTHNQW